LTPFVADLHADVLDHIARDRNSRKQHGDGDVHEDGEQHTFLQQVAGFVAAQQHRQRDEDGRGDQQDYRVEVQPGKRLDPEPVLPGQQPPDPGRRGGGDQQDPEGPFEVEEKGAEKRGHLKIAALLRLIVPAPA
jgi:hypothetical protein